MPGPTPEQWKANAEAVSRAAPRLARNLPSLIQWATANQKGWPRTSPAYAGDGQIRIPESVTNCAECAEERCDKHVSPPAYSDTVGESAVAGPDISQRVAKVVKRVDRLFTELLLLDGAVDGLMPDKPQRGRENSIPQCVNCGEDCVPRAKAGRCPKCYEYRRSHGGKDRPLDGGRDLRKHSFERKQRVSVHAGQKERPGHGHKLEKGSIRT